jgi:hypothetical protein
MAAADEQAVPTGDASSAVGTLSASVAIAAVRTCRAYPQFIPRPWGIPRISMIRAGRSRNLFKPGPKAENLTLRVDFNLRVRVSPRTPPLLSALRVAPCPQPLSVR